MAESSHNHLAEHFFRHNYAKMVAVLVRYFGLKEVEIAEDIVQDALIEAMEKWSIQPIPDNPEGWLMDVAKKKTINFLRRNQLYESKIIPNLKSESFFEINETVEKNSTLRMIFACCHPALPAESQIALALKSLCGLSVSEIANALLTTESTINKRLYRAKQKFRDGSITFQIPNENDLNERLDNVFASLYLLFNEGYYSAHHEEIIRTELCFEAIRLLKEIIISFPDSKKAKALLALMLFSVARFESRIDEKDTVVILAKQDRSLWDKQLITEGMHYLNDSTQGCELSAYHLQAGIAAEHCMAGDFETTNWKSIYRQYCLLEKLDEHVMVTFNKTIAKFYGIDKQEALSDLLALKNEPKLQNNRLYHASIGVFYQELNQKDQAVPYFEKALKLSKSNSEKSLILEKLKGH